MLLELAGRHSLTDLMPFIAVRGQAVSPPRLSPPICGCWLRRSGYQDGRSTKMLAMNEKRPEDVPNIGSSESRNGLHRVASAISAVVANYNAIVARYDDFIATTLK